MGNFVALADVLRSARSVPVSTFESSDVAFALPSDTERSTESSASLHEDLIPSEDIALLRLRVVEAFERAKTRLLRRFADDLLARELLLSPVDIEALARRALDAFAEEDPLAIIVSREEAPLREFSVPVRADRALRGGDLVVEVRDGCLESPLSLRFERILEQITAEENTV